MSRTPLDRRDFLAAAGAALGGAWLGSQEPAASRPLPPNVVVILADDLGYAELGVQGCRDIATPHIDALAAAGVRCTDGYVSCPVCAPTRAGLMTGRYQQRFGFETNPGPEAYADETFGLPREEPTLAERLKALGYATGMVGKWHLGYRPGLTPPDRGFDEFFGFLGGAHPYLPGAPRAAAIRRGREPAVEREYLTDAFGREAADFIGRHRGHPFFLYLSFNAVHSPLQASPRHLERFAAIADPKRRTYAAMTAAMDEAVGRVTAALAEAGLDGRTLVFFLGDNGGPTLQTTSSNRPLRGYKGQVLEGGIRVPFFLRWPGRLPANRVYREPVIALDILPTALAAAGRPAPGGLDGVDLLPYLAGHKSVRPHGALFWRFHDQRALRQGGWKLVAREPGSAWELYHLGHDIAEETDLAAALPDKVAELDAIWQQWNAGLAAPRWRRRDARTGGRQGAAPAAQGTDPAGRFRELDQNSDGKLTPGEVGRPRLFRQLDQNGDGVITLEEARAALGGRSRPGGGR